MQNNTNIRAKMTWELEGEKCTKHFSQKLQKKKYIYQAILSVKRGQNGEIIKDQREILTEIKHFYEQLYGQKRNVQERIEINASPSAIGQNNQIQSIKQFNFNPKRCGPKGNNMQYPQEKPKREKLRMQPTLISKVKKSYIGCTFKFPNQDDVGKQAAGSYILFVQKRRQKKHN